MFIQTKITLIITYKRLNKIVNKTSKQSIKLNFNKYIENCQKILIF